MFSSTAAVWAAILTVVVDAVPLVFPDAPKLARMQVFGDSFSDNG